jgi:hypothetical protein
VLALHITLGVFQRLFELLELDYHKLDLKLAQSSVQIPTSSASYERYMDAKRKAMAIQEEIEQREGQLQGMEQLATYIALVMSATATDSRLALIHQKADELKRKISIHTAGLLVYISILTPHSIESREGSP